MEKLKLLTYETIPCWYELSFPRSGKTALMLRIHSDCANHFKTVPSNSRRVEQDLKDFGFKKFSGAMGANFGFEEALQYRGVIGDFLEYEIPIPLCYKPTGQPCQYCGGSGKREIFDDECIFCEGKGRGFAYDYKEILAISASLTLLLFIIQFPEVETKSKLPQLFTINTVTILGPHGGSLGGKYSSELVSCLKARQPGTILEMVESMKTIWETTQGRVREFDQYYFQAYTQGENGWLNVSCPGDACGLNPSSPFSPTDRDRGYEFSCHNVDTPIQQLTLLASLAALHDLARAAGV